MDDSLREMIEELAEKHGIEPELLVWSLSSGNMSEAMQEAVTAVLGDTELFERAVSEVKRTDQ